MAAQPKKKLSRSRSRRRLATKKVLARSLVKCSNCGNLKIPHTLCKNCGYYNDRAVIEKKEEIKVTKVEK